MDKKKCETCRFWQIGLRQYSSLNGLPIDWLETHGSEYDDIEKGFLGECRKRSNNGAFPIRTKDDWCDEHVEKFVKESMEDTW